MSKSNLHETAYLKLYYQNIAHANIGDSNGLQPSADPGNFYVALYTTDPTDADVGTEATYTGYARKSIVRSAVGFDVVDNLVSNALAILFDEATAGSETITHWALRTALAGGDLLIHAPLDTARLVNAGTKLNIAVGAVSNLED